MYKHEPHSKKAQNQLIKKNSQLHAQKLKRLKQQISIYNTVDPNPGQFPTKNSFMTIGSVKQKESDKFGHFGITLNVEVNQIPNKSKYFHKINQKNIQKQNKILFQKIEGIYKGKKRDINQYLHIHSKSISIIKNHEQQNLGHLNKTSFLTAQMIKNKATRSLIKQRQIRDQNQKMLQRLVSLKPTISTRKILKETKRTNGVSKRMSKFNTFTDHQSGRQDLNDTGHFSKKQLSLDVRTFPQGQQKDGQQIIYKQKRRLSNLTKKGMPESIQSSKKVRQTHTQPIFTAQVTKIPHFHQSQMTDVQNQFMEKPKQPTQDIIDKTKCLSVSQYQKHFKDLSKIAQKNRRSNSSYNVLTAGEANQSRPIHHKKQMKGLFPLNVPLKPQPKPILLARIQKHITKDIVCKFKFVRLESHYQIEIKQKKQKDQKKDQMQIQGKKQEQVAQTFGSHYSMYKVYCPAKESSKQRSMISSQQNKNVQIVQQRTSKKQKMTQKIQQSTILLSQSIGSSLFSLFDYDYHKIIEQCLEFCYKQKQIIHVQLKKQYTNYEQRQLKLKNKNQIIKENNQYQEEDQVYHVNNDG